MTFNELTRSAADIAQVLAIGIGGTWAYIKYIRGRTFKLRGELNVNGTILAASSGRAIHARVDFQNTGLTRIIFESPSKKMLFAYELRSSGWEPDAQLNVDWGEEAIEDLSTMRSPALRDHDWVEPGETVSDEILLPVGNEGPIPLAYQLVAHVTAPRRRGFFFKAKGPEWTARAVLPIGLQPVTVNPGEAVAALGGHKGSSSVSEKSRASASEGS